MSIYFHLQKIKGKEKKMGGGPHGGQPPGEPTMAGAGGEQRRC
jgi:hypothetical protein